MENETYFVWSNWLRLDDFIDKVRLKISFNSTVMQN